MRGNLSSVHAHCRTRLKGFCTGPWGDRVIASQKRASSNCLKQGQRSGYGKTHTSCVDALVASYEALAAFESVSVAALVLNVYTCHWLP